MRLRYAIAGFVSGACGPNLPDAELHAVDPGWGYNGEETSITLSGRHFYPRVQARGEEALEIDHDFSVYLYGPDFADLAVIEITDYEHLEARVPAGLDVGDYDIVLEGVGGGASRLYGAFAVTDTRADRFDLQVDSVTHEVNTLARLELSLLDPEENEVPMPMDIRVVVTGPDGATGVSFEDTLNNQTELATENGITGSLGPNGLAYLALTSRVSEDLWITVSAADEGSVVQSDSQFLAFTAGEVSRVELTLPDDLGESKAGDSFPLEIQLYDALDNPTEGVTAALTISEACGDNSTRFERTIQFIDSEILDDAFATGATGTASCMENRFYASGTASGAFIEGASVGFELQPGTVTQFEVEASPSETMVGPDPLYVRVEAQDQYANPVPDFSESLTLTDDAGGLDPETAMGEQQCNPFSSGVTFCQAWPWKSGDEVIVTASSAEGIEGSADPVRILPGTPAEVLVGLSASTVAAGEVFELTVRAIDSYGNTVPLDAEGVDAPAIGDSNGGTSCTWSGTGIPEGTETFSCTSVNADPEVTILVEIPSSGVSGESNLLEVTNGDLASADIDLDGMLSTVAGESFEVEIETWDSFGNPYIVQTITTIGLYDQGGEIAGDVLSLDAAGRASATATLTRAMLGNALVVRNGLTELGTSGAFDVLSSDMDTFEVEPTATWTWVDDQFSIQIRAVDQYGNIVEDYGGDVLLASYGGFGEDLDVAITGGVAEVDFVYAETAISDSLVVDDGNFTGESSVIDAVMDCESGPDAIVLVGGQEQLVQCLVGGATPAVSIDASDSIEGNAALESWHYDSGYGNWSRSSSDSTTQTWNDAGHWSVTALVVDANGCGSAATAQVWTAESDGSPAGPVTAVSDSASMIAGSSTTGRVTVDLDAKDCTGDPSAGGTLFARVDLGEIDLLTGDAASTGGGIEVTLDGSGEASLEWSVEDSDQAGEGTIEFGRSEGQAYGSATVNVTGDAHGPTVLYMDPVGTVVDQFDGVRIEFSEAMLEGSLVAGPISLLQPDGVEAELNSISLSGDGTTLDLELQQPGDGASGVWTFALSSNIRDEAGNRIDGRYTGSSSTFAIEFGDVPDSSVDVDTCAIDRDIFRPDGDDGTGSDADFVEIDFSAASLPGWWEIEILDQSGLTTNLDRAQATAANESWSWDGRDIDGFIAPPGDYLLVLTALDDSWNHGASCELDVTIEQVFTSPY